jgi:hypothetical protein
MPCEQAPVLHITNARWTQYIIGMLLAESHGKSPELLNREYSLGSDVEDVALLVEPLNSLDGHDETDQGRQLRQWD